MRNTIAGILAIALSLGAGAVLAAETVSYAYDAKGRLIKVVHSGTINNGVIVDYTHDTADNRTNVKTTGSSS